MSNIRPFINAMRRFLGASEIAVRSAVWIRNQAEWIIRYHLGEEPNHLVNGEASLSRTLAPFCKSFVDIGANRGAWSEDFLKMMPPGGVGLLIDASAAAVGFLRGRFEGRPGVEIIHAAAGETVGEMTFFEEGSIGETSSLVAGFSTPGAILVKVPVTTLDVELARCGWAECDFVKIDAEGYDLHVLRGARALLAAHKLGVIQFEYNVPWAQAGSTLAAALSLLQGHGYQVFHVRPDSLCVPEYARYREYFGYSNFVAFSPAWFDRMQSRLKFSDDFGGRES